MRTDDAPGEHGRQERLVGRDARNCPGRARLVSQLLEQLGLSFLVRGDMLQEVNKRLNVGFHRAQAFKNVAQVAAYTCRQRFGFIR